MAPLITSDIFQLTGSVGNSPPPSPGHERVVEDVEKRYLAVFLPQHKENLME